MNNKFLLIFLKGRITIHCLLGAEQSKAYAAVVPVLGIVEGPIRRTRVLSIGVPTTATEHAARA